MPEQLFANVASTTLNASITSSQTSVTVVSSANFPAANALAEQEFRAAFVDTAVPPNILEYVSVTQVTGTTWTIVREAEDATRFPKAARASGTRIIMLTTRAVLESFERRSRTVGHNVLDYGAIGNSNHNTAGGADDTASIQDAIDASRAASGQAVVIFPGRRTYRITSSLIHTTGGQLPIQMVGLGNMNAAGLIAMPTIVWDGAEDGTMCYVGTTNVNLPGALFRNLNFRGTQQDVATTVGLPAYAIRFLAESSNAAKIDTGSGLDECWFQRIKGNAVQSEVIGLTNWWIRGGRFDQVNGYAIYVRVAGQSIMSIRDLTYDSWNGAAPGHGLGLTHFDASSGGASGIIYVHLDTMHPEVNATQLEANPGGTDPADRCGVIHCSIDPTTGALSHAITLTNYTNQGGSTKTKSTVLMLGGTTTQRAGRLSLMGRNLRGFTGDGTSATGHTIPIGGIPSGDKSPYTSGSYSVLEYAPGTNATHGIFGSETPHFWRHNSAGNTNTNA
jgi:hypothetical protein